MARPFDFKDSVKDKARIRQQALCAQCGEDLNNLEEHAHHVIPNQSGDPGNTGHDWLRSAENCVIVCDMCHWRVHENGKYQQGAVAPPSYYEHSHGKFKASHRKWVSDLESLSKSIWD